MGAITTVAVIAILTGIIWLIIALTKKRRTANPKGWRIPTIILASGIVLSIIAGAISGGLEKRQVKKRVQEEAATQLRLAKADSVFAWTIAENPNTVSRSGISRAVGTFQERHWDIPENLRKRWIDLRLAWVDTLSSNAKTLTECANANSALNEIRDYRPLSQSQRSKFDGLKNRLSYKTKVLKAKADKEERLAKIKARKNFAPRLERTYLDKRMDVTVTTLGQNATTLKVKWILASRVDAYEIGNDAEFLQLLRELGFKKFIITDGYDETWYWNL